MDRRRIGNNGMERDEIVNGSKVSMMGYMWQVAIYALTQFRSLNFPEHKQRAKCHQREREGLEDWTERSFESV